MSTSSKCSAACARILYKGLFQAQLTQHRDGIRVIDITVDVIPKDDIVELGKERDETDVAINDFLEAP
jgi:hypothetical protein